MLLQAKTKKYKYTALWDGIKNLIECNSAACNSIKCNVIEKIIDKPVEYGKDFMKIKFNSENDLLLNKILKLRSLAIGVRSVFQEDKNYYL